MPELRGRCPVHPEDPHGAMKNVDDRFWGHDGKFEYARCKTCGTLALDPRLSPEALTPFYADYYPKDRLAKVARAVASGRYQRLRSRKVRTLKRVGLDVKDRDVLDVGTGLGHFLDAAKRAGAKSVRGVDFGADCVNFVRETYKLDVDEGELKDQNYDDGAFSLVTAWHVLEHVYDPLEELIEMARVTAPGGHVFVEVPVRTPIAHLFGRFWMPMQAPTHFWHFTPKTLVTLFERAGLEVQKVSRGFQPGEVATSSAAMFTKGLMPKIMRRPIGLRGLYVGVVTLLELPVTLPMTWVGHGGLLRVLAVKRT